MPSCAPFHVIGGVAMAMPAVSAHARARHAEHQLAELRAAGQLGWVRISELVTDTITAEEEIEPVLQRIREAIAAQLTEGKHVRLQ